MVDQIKNRNLALAQLLEEHRSEIVASWTQQALALSSTRYQQAAPETLTLWVSQALEQVINLLARGPGPELTRYLEELATARIEAGFEIADVIAAFLLAKEAITPSIFKTLSMDPPAMAASIAALDTGIRSMLGQFGNIFAEAMQDKYSQETQKRLAEGDSLQRTTTALLTRLTLDEVLEIVCSEACRLTSATGSAVLLLEEDDWLSVAIGIGSPLPVLDRLTVEASLAGQAIRRGQPWLTNDPEHQLQAYQRNPHLQSLLVIPLRARKTFIGVLDVVNKPGGFTDEDIRVLGLFASQAAIAIENARLQQQAEELAVIQERQRLARELHDSVTQALYSISLFTDAARLALSTGKQKTANDHLAELRSMVREAMLDMRLLIFELHPPILEDEGLVAALQARLEAVEARSGVKTELKVQGEPRLPLAIETELYRIAQEALTNVVKHAGAEEVGIEVQAIEDLFSLKIWDNGNGFDVNALEHSGGLGLRGIKERGQQIGGVVSLDSIPGKGTTLTVEIRQ